METKSKGAESTTANGSGYSSSGRNSDAGTLSEGPKQAENKLQHQKAPGTSEVANSNNNDRNGPKALRFSVAGSSSSRSSDHQPKRIMGRKSVGSSSRTLLSSVSGSSTILTTTAGGSSTSLTVGSSNPGAQRVCQGSVRLGEEKEKRRSLITFSSTAATSTTDEEQQPGAHHHIQPRLLGENKTKRDSRTSGASGTEALTNTDHHANWDLIPQLTEALGDNDNNNKRVVDDVESGKEEARIDVDGYLKDDYIEPSTSTIPDESPMIAAPEEEEESPRVENPMQEEAAMNEQQKEELAVARQVEEFPQAEGFDEEAQQKRRQKHKQKNQWLLLAGLVVMIVIVVIIVALLVSRGKQESNETLAPSPAPSMAPTHVSQGLMDLLPSYTRQAIEESSTSPQAKAFEWMMNDASLMDYPNWRRVQRFALAAFYYATGGEEDWYNNTGWMSYDSHECTWPNFNSTVGLFETFDKETGETTGYEFQVPEYPCYAENSTEPQEFKDLWISDNGLVGTIPEELWLLTSLRNLALHINPRLGSSISTQIGKMTDLEGVALSFTNEGDENQLTFQIPSEIGRCTHLRFSVSTAVNMTGTLPTQLGNLQSLEILYIGENPNSKASLPSELGRLEKLKWLNGPYSGLRGTLPTQLGLLTALTDMELSMNNFHGTIPTEMGGLSSMIYFSIPINYFNGTIPSQFGLLPDLIWLNLRNNQFTGHLPSDLGALSGMSMFSLRHNHLSGSIPTQYGNFGSGGFGGGMQRLSLNDNDLTGVIPSELGKVPSLGYLHLQDNQELSGPLPSELGLVNILREFNISGTAVTGTVPADLCYLGTNCTYMFYDGWYHVMRQADCVLDFECSTELCGCDCNCTTN